MTVFPFLFNDNSKRIDVHTYLIWRESPEYRSVLSARTCKQFILYNVTQCREDAKQISGQNQSFTDTACYKKGNGGYTILTTIKIPRISGNAWDIWIYPGYRKKNEQLSIHETSAAGAVNVHQKREV